MEELKKTIIELLYFKDDLTEDVRLKMVKLFYIRTFIIFIVSIIVEVIHFNNGSNIEDMFLILLFSIAVQLGNYMITNKNYKKAYTEKILTKVKSDEIFKDLNIAMFNTKDLKQITKKEAKEAGLFKVKDFKNYTTLNYNYKNMETIMSYSISEQVSHGGEGTDRRTLASGIFAKIKLNTNVNDIFVTNNLKKVEFFKSLTKKLINYETHYEKTKMKSLKGFLIYLKEGDKNPSISQEIIDFINKRPFLFEYSIVNNNLYIMLNSQKIAFEPSKDFLNKNRKNENKEAEDFKKYLNENINCFVDLILKIKEKE